MKTFLFSLLLCLSQTVLAGNYSKIESINFKNLKNSVEVEVLFDKVVTDIPKVSVRDKFVQLAIAETEVWPKIEKSVTTYKPFDTKVMAYQFNKETTRVRAIMPHSVNVNPDDIRMTLGKKRIVFTVPKDQKMAKVLGGRYPAIARQEREPAVAAVAKPAKKEASNYDESYLSRLLKEKDEEIERTLDQGNESKELAPAQEVAKGEEPIQVDQVQNVLAAPQKEIEFNSAKKEESSFSVMSYVGKYVAFLALVLLLFYGVMSLMRKGVLKKGKLGFLNSTKVVEVLNTTYIGPKRSLMLVKAHDQVFLLANSEKGINLIHEVKDVTGLLKEGEKAIAGDNFDLNLGDAGNKGKEFNLKEDIRKTAKENTNVAAELTKDTVKLSDQIKSKVKNLKSLQ